MVMTVVFREFFFYLRNDQWLEPLPYHEHETFAFATENGTPKLSCKVALLLLLHVSHFILSLLPIISLPLSLSLSV